MATELGVAYISLLPEMKSFRPAAEKGMDRVGRGVATRFGVGFNGAIGSIVSRSAGIFAAGFASVQVGGFLKDAISQASDLGETTSKVGQIFGPAAKEILAFSKSSATALGQTQQAALDANATFGIFGKAAGLQGKQLSGFTTELTTLASDLASFNNTTPEQAIEAIGAALRGETEPMRAYGVLLDDASLRQQALSQGLIKTTKEALTPQQKVLAAHALIMKQTTTAQGDFARTSGGLANQQRILSARFSDFKTSIGAIALPLVTRLFGFLNDKAVPVLGEIRGGFVAFFAAFKANDGDITSSGFPGFMERIGFYAARAFGIFKTEVLPRLKDFAGFVTGNAIPAVRNLVAAFTPLATDVGDGATSVFQRLLPAVRSLGEFVAGTVVPAIRDFTGFLKENQTLVGSLAVGVGAMVVAFKAYHMVLGIITVATKAYAAAQAILTALWAASGIGTVILLLAGVAAGLVYAYKNSEKFRTVVNAVFNAVKGVVTTVINALIAAFRAVVAEVSWAVNGVRTVWSTITKVVSAPLNAVIGFLRSVWSRISPIISLPIYIALGLIKGYLTLLAAAFTAVKNWVVGAFSKAWSAVKTVLSGPVSDAKRSLDTQWGLIKGAFTAVKDWVTGAFSRAWSGLTAKMTKPVNDAKAAIATVLSAAKGGLQWVFSQAVAKIGTIWTGLQELAKAPIRFIVNTVLNGGLIDAFNWIAGKFQAPTIPHFNLPKGFASGGHFDGRLPGKPSAVDNMLGWAKGKAVGLATGEFITNARDTARNLPVLRYINNGGVVPGFADGGLFGKLKSSVSSAFSLGKELGTDAIAFLEGPVNWLKNRFKGPLEAMSSLGDSPFAKIIKAVPSKLAGTITDKAKALLGDLFGGPAAGGPGIGGGRRGGYGGVKPWVAAAGDMIRRMFGVNDIGGVGGRGNASDHPSGHALDFMVYRNKGLGDRIASYMMTMRDRMRLTYLIWYDRIASASRGWRWRPYTHPNGPTSNPTLRHLDHVHASFRRNVPGFAGGGQVTPKSVAPRAALSFDSGGMLPTGYSVVHNGTGKPEPVGHDFLRKADLNGMKVVLEADGIGKLNAHIDLRAERVQTKTASKYAHEFQVS